MAHLRCECGSSEAFGVTGEHLSMCPRCLTPVSVEVIAKPYTGLEVSPASPNAGETPAPTVPPTV